MIWNRQRAWYFALQSFLIQEGFIGSKSDTSLFLSNLTNRRSYLCWRYHHNGSDSIAIEKFLKSICHTFDCRYLGNLGFFLGMEIIRTNSQLCISQARYASTLLKHCNMELCSSVATLMATNFTSSLKNSSSEALSNPTEFGSLVGGLIYLTLSWLDIAFAMNSVAHASTDNTSSIGGEKNLEIHQGHYYTESSSYSSTIF